MPLKLVYIAGRYTSKTRAGVLANVQAAREVADAVNPVRRLRGHAALPRRWHRGLLVPGWELSKGALAERAFAIAAGLPVFADSDYASLTHWPNRMTTEEK